MKKALVGFVVAGATFVGMTGTSSASHEHYVIREDQDGVTHCRYIAGGQTSKGPGDGGYHQFHGNVHLGQPGADARGTDFDKDSNEGTRCDVVNENGQH